MNSKPQFKNFWQPIAVKNLSDHADEKFKLVNFYKTDKNAVLFSLYETLRGRKTDTGFVLVPPEFIWLKNVIKSNDSSVHTLEHNNRIITIDKTNSNFQITVQKSNGVRTNLQINPNEITILLAFIQEHEEKLKNCLNVSSEFSETSFHRHTIS